MLYKYIVENQKGKIFKRTKKTHKHRGQKLNLGCGNSHIIGYINMDIQEPCDLKADIRDPLPFKDNSLDEIFSEGNTICTITKKEWFKLKKEMARVIKPGGKLELDFLDFEYILKAFLENKDGQRWGWWHMTIFGGQENEFDICKNGFTREKLISDLEEEGFDKFSVNRLDKEEDLRLICYKKIT